MFELQENQTVFISFNTERMKDDRVTVEVDKRLIEATKVNPYTFSFICKGNWKLKTVNGSQFA